MINSPNQPSPLLTVRVIHLALTVAPVFVIVALWVALGGRIIVPALQGAAAYAAYGLVAAGFGFGFWWRGRIPGRAAGSREIEYWRDTMPKALVLWAVLEVVVTVATVIAILAGHSVVAVLALMIYLSLMLFSSPGRLAGE